jgi:hypothetical protein
MKGHLTEILIIIILISCQPNFKPRQEIADIKPSDCKITGNHTYDIETIIQGQTEELENDSIIENFKTLIDQKIDFLKRAGNKIKPLFPYSKFDSAIYIAYDQYDNKKMNYTLKERHPKFATVLCSEKARKIIDLVNDPGNFGYGECGTQIPEAHILFFSGDKQVAEILFSCGHGRITCEPENILTNFGGLSGIGNNRLDEIAPWR